MRWGVVPFGTILVVFSASLFPVGGGGFGDVLPGFYNPFWGGDTLSVTKRYYTWGGPGVDGGGAVMLGAGKSLYLVGGTDLYGPRGGDFVLLKWTTGGEVVWERTWGGPDYDDGIAVTVAEDGSIYTLGRTQSLGAGGKDFALVKWTPAGEVVWERTWGGESQDEPRDVVVQEGSVYGVGITGSFQSKGGDFAVVKWRTNGSEVRYATWGGSELDGGTDLTVGADGTIYTSGVTYSHGAGGADLVLVIFTPNGTPWWAYLVIGALVGASVVAVIVYYTKRKKHGHTRKQTGNVGEGPSRKGEMVITRSVNRT